MGDRVVVLTGRHRPHEVMLIFAAVLLGLGYLAGTPPPSSLAQQLPPPLLSVWYGVLFAGGAVGAAGLLTRHIWWSLQLERAAMLALTGAAAEHGLALAVYGGGPAAGAVTLLFAWSAANAWRAWQITRDLRLLRNGNGGLP